jgi:hypothetical protein
MTWHLVVAPPASLSFAIAIVRGATAAQTTTRNGLVASVAELHDVASPLNSEEADPCPAPRP